MVEVVGMEKTRVVCYCRVSTKSKEQLNSFENQKEFFEDYIARHPEYQLYKSPECPTGIYADKGISGTLLHREAFDLMLTHAGLIAESQTYTDVPKRMGEELEALITYREYVFKFSKEKPKFTKILVRNTSRFSRNIMIADVLRKLQAVGVYVEFLDIDKSTENASDLTIIQFFQTFDEMFSRDLSRKLLSANEQSRRNQILRSNPDLFGYDYHKRRNNAENNYLTIKPEEAYIIQMMFRLYNGCFYIDPYNLHPEPLPTMPPCDFDCSNCEVECVEGLGLRLIMVVFNDIMGFRTRAGQPFAQSTIKHIFENEKYFGGLNTGKWDHGPLFSRYATPKIREGFEVIERPDIIPPIISRELFDRCWSKRNTRCDAYKAAGGVGGKPSKYRGKFICADCGRAMTHNIGNNGNGLYNCRTKKLNGKHHCSNGNIYDWQIEKELKIYCESELSDILQNSTVNVISVLVQQINDKLGVIERNKGDRIKELEKQIKTLTTTLSNLYLRQANPLTSTDALEKAISQAEEEMGKSKAEHSRLTKKPQTLLKECAELLDLCYNALEVLQSQQKVFTEEELWGYIECFKVKSEVVAIKGGMHGAPDVKLYPVLKTEKLLTTQYGIDPNAHILAEPILFNFGFEEKNFYEQAKFKIDELAERVKATEKPYFSSMDSVSHD